MVPVGGGGSQDCLTVLTLVTECVGKMFGLDMREDVTPPGLSGGAQAAREAATPGLRDIQLKVLRFGDPKYGINQKTTRSIFSSYTHDTDTHISIS